MGSSVAGEDTTSILSQSVAPLQKLTGIHVELSIAIPQVCLKTNASLWYPQTHSLPS